MRSLFPPPVVQNLYDWRTSFEGQLNRNLLLFFFFLQLVILLYRYIKAMAHTAGHMVENTQQLICELVQFLWPIINFGILLW